MIVASYLFYGWSGWRFCVPLLAEWFQRCRDHGLEIADKPLIVGGSFNVTAVATILGLGNIGSQEFIHFQY